MPSGSDDEGALVEAFLGADRLPVRVGPTLLLAADVPGRHRAVSWFVACPVPPHDADAAALAEELAGLVALERARVDAGRRADSRVADQVLRELATGGSELMVALRVAGVAPRTPSVVLASTAGASELIEEILRTVVPDPLVGVRGSRVLAVVPVREAHDVASTVRTGLAAVATSLAGTRVPVGMSGVVAAGPALYGALEEAGHAADLAAARVEPTAVVTADEIDSHLLLLGSVPDEVRRAYRERMLGAVLAYDATHDVDLVATLAAFLDANGSWAACAARLHLHVNTIRYRIARVEQLTGRDLARLDHRVDLFLALRL